MPSFFNIFFKSKLILINFDTQSLRKFAKSDSKFIYCAWENIATLSFFM